MGKNEHWTLSRFVVTYYTQIVTQPDHDIITGRLQNLLLQIYTACPNLTKKKMSKNRTICPNKGGFRTSNPLKRFLGINPLFPGGSITSISGSGDHLTLFNNRFFFQKSNRDYFECYHQPWLKCQRFF